MSEGSERRDPLDARGLIREAYRMEGLGAAECRSIYLDWALGLPDDADASAASAALLARHAPNHTDHPMTTLLREGAVAPPRPARRRRKRS